MLSPNAKEYIGHH